MNEKESMPSIGKPSVDQIQVSYLGPPGTYSHEAAMHCFGGGEYNLVPFTTINKVVHSLLPDTHPTRSLWAIVPIENSYFGPVLETQETLAEPEIIAHTSVLADKIFLKINHCLVGPKDLAPDHLQSPQIDAIHKASIKVVASHEQALGQCKNYLEKNYPTAQRLSTSSTAEGAKLAANDSTYSTLAICSETCAKNFSNKLKLMDQNIQDAEKANETTFIIIQAKV